MTRPGDELAGGTQPATFDLVVGVRPRFAIVRSE